MLVKTNNIAFRRQNALKEESVTIILRKSVRGARVFHSTSQIQNNPKDDMNKTLFSIQSLSFIKTKLLYSKQSVDYQNPSIFIRAETQL